ncbi:hypothetical protein ACGIF2_03025 [Cellulomonas sp. P22]|uniref:hypothetical protein n=1 Tax=Cellulomonas sp. P22 TaxID=3373189 RepID=UPI0037B5AEBE
MSTAQKRRTRAALVLVLVGVLLAPVALVVTWTRGLVVDTDRYLATIGPLASDPHVQAAVTDALTAAILDAADLEQRIGDATSALAAGDLPPRVAATLGSLEGPLVDAADGFVRRTVSDVVTSDRFADLWVEANQRVHEQLVATLRGDPDARFQIDEQGHLVVQLNSATEAVRQELVARGFTIVEQIPTRDLTFAVVDSQDLTPLQGAYRWLDVLGTWLPWLVLALVVGALVLAADRWRVVFVGGVWLAVALLLLAAGLVVGRQVYLGQMPDASVDSGAAAAVYAQVIHQVAVAALIGAAVGIIAAVIAWLVRRRRARSAPAPA